MNIVVGTCLIAHVPCRFVILLSDSKDYFFILYLVYVGFNMLLAGIALFHWPGSEQLELVNDPDGYQVSCRLVFHALVAANMLRSCLPCIMCSQVWKARVILYSTHDCCKHAADLSCIHECCKHAVNLSSTHDCCKHAVNLSFMHDCCKHAVNLSLMHVCCKHVVNLSSMHDCCACACFRQAFCLCTISSSHGWHSSSCTAGH